MPTLTAVHQHIEQHKGSAIGIHFSEEHSKDPYDIATNFQILRKCQSKPDCLIFETFFIKELKLKINKQNDSIHAKLFV